MSLHFHISIARNYWITVDTRSEDTFFSIIADEVTSKHSNQYTLSICPRFVTWRNETLSIKDFSFFYLTTTTGLAVASCIKETAYDGASAMSSDRCGVQAQMWKSAPMDILHTIGVMCSI